MQKIEDQVKRNTVRGFFMTLYVGNSVNFLRNTTRADNYLKPVGTGAGDIKRE